MTVARPSCIRGLIVNAENADFDGLAHLSWPLFMFRLRRFLVSRIGLGQPLRRASRTLGFESKTAWDTQVNFSTTRSTARHFEFRSNPFRPLAHARKAPVAVASCMQDVGIDPAAVVADEHPELAGGIFHFHFDFARPGMAKGIDQGLAAD